MPRPLQSTKRKWKAKRAEGNGQRITRLMRKQAESLFEKVEEQDAFLELLVDGDSKEHAMIVMRDHAQIGAFPKHRSLGWQPEFVHRILGDFRPSKHPLYVKGNFYTLDFSSIFAASILQAIDERPNKVLDLCSSPGGKAIFTYRMFHPELTVCNETVRKRCTTLIDNLTRCQVEGAAVGSADSSVYARKAAGQFDLVIVDAPCSGQSLLAKGKATDDAFQPSNIEMCVGRQRRILSNAVECVRPGGYVLYMTCTYSKKENEKVIEWLLREAGEGVLSAVEWEPLAEFRSIYSEVPCYRLFPQSNLGAGAFCALIRKVGGVEPEGSLDQLPLFWRYGQVNEALEEADED